VSLYLADALTVATAASVTIVTSLLTIAPLLVRVTPWRQDLRVDRKLLRDGLRFGTKAWANQLGSSANARLDQLLMIPLVSARELGLYAVGVNAASISGLFTTALTVPLGVRVARGEAHLAARALRMALWGSALVAILLAAAIPIVLPLLFGDAFSDATAMAQILLVASIPNAGRSVLAPALTAAGRPGAGAMSQTLALVITVPSLLLVLPSMGGTGAALVSLVAYSITFAVLLPIARRHLGLGFGQLLLPRRGDLHWTLTHLAGAGAAARRRLGRRRRR
jgi:O-antigen/teichoic acid export membrane protein